jgi:hypothetical protein
MGRGDPDDMVLQHRLWGVKVARLQKPFTAEALAEKVRDILEQAEALISSPAPRRHSGRPHPCRVHQPFVRFIASFGRGVRSQGGVACTVMRAVYT